MSEDLEGFIDFWKVYPRHIGKLDAQKAYRAAIKLASPAEIVNAARKYAFECIGKPMEYVKYPAGWLRAGRWGDVLSRTVDKPEDTAPVSVPGKVEIKLGTPAFAAWDAYWKKTRGVHAPFSTRSNSWWFPSEYPPEQVPA